MSRTVTFYFRWLLLFYRETVAWHHLFSPHDKQRNVRGKGRQKRVFLHATRSPMISCLFLDFTTALLTRKRFFFFFLSFLNLITVKGESSTRRQRGRHDRDACGGGADERSRIGHDARVIKRPTAQCLSARRQKYSRAFHVHYREKEREEGRKRRRGETVEFNGSQFGLKRRTLDCINSYVTTVFLEDDRQYFHHEQKKEKPLSFVTELRTGNCVTHSGRKKIFIVRETISFGKAN